MIGISNLKSTLRESKVTINVTGTIKVTISIIKDIKKYLSVLFSICILLSRFKLITDYKNNKYSALKNIDLISKVKNIANTLFAVL